MEFYVDKSYVMEMGKSERQPVGIYKMGDGVDLEKVKKEKDLGVTMEENNQPDRPAEEGQKGHKRTWTKTQKRQLQKRLQEKQLPP
ncbi:hypothetical protein E2C01_040318 [Portunus trituberculatus]|uniref:Uncharacterized protein n=1 Tax=Portunus trituberculatus TaxID=210409 RepID=A0A5B7FM86_PORTR|nr:hypothetical protein [Portunus trituberculatus]